MRDKLIAAIREVPISQTYEEYVEALADRLSRKASEVAGKIIKDLVNFLDDNKKEMLVNGHSVWFVNADDLTEFIEEIKEEYTESEKDNG